MMDGVKFRGNDGSVSFYAGNEYDAYEALMIMKSQQERNSFCGYSFCADEAGSEGEREAQYH